MRYNAFFGELPINAFKPRAGGGMTFEGGGNPLDSVTNAIGDAVSGVTGAVSDAGSQFDDFVNEEVPGGWATVALAAAGAYYAPEIGAYISSDGAVLGATEAEAATNLGAVSSPVTSGVANGVSLGELGSLGGAEAALSPVVAADVGSYGAVAPVTAEGASAGGLGAVAGGTTAAELAGAGAAGAGAAGAGAAAAGIGSTLKDALIAGTVGSAISGIAGADAAKDAAATQAAAADRAAAQQQANFELINKQQAPYRAAGYGALGNLGSLGTGTYQMYDASGAPTTTGTGSGYLQHQFDATDLAKGLAPNYDFMLQQGQMANQRAANVAGGALGGNALQGLNKYTQDYAGNAYQNAFTNYQNQRNNIYNTLAGIAGIGQTGQTATNTAATNATNAATQLGVGSAAAQAAGTIGSTNAYTGAINNAMNNYTLASLLQQGGRVG